MIKRFKQGGRRKRRKRRHSCQSSGRAGVVTHLSGFLKKWTSKSRLMHMHTLASTGKYLRRLCVVCSDGSHFVRPLPWYEAPAERQDSESTKSPILISSDLLLRSRRLCWRIFVVVTQTFVFKSLLESTPDFCVRIHSEQTHIHTHTRQLQWKRFCDPSIRITSESLFFSFAANYLFSSGVYKNSARIRWKYLSKIRRHTSMNAPFHEHTLSWSHTPVNTHFR